MSWHSSEEIDEESHGRNSAIILTGMLHRNCHTNDACSSNENFSISKGKTCQIQSPIFNLAGTFKLHTIAILLMWKMTDMTHPIKGSSVLYSFYSPLPMFLQFKQLFGCWVEVTEQVPHIRINPNYISGSHRRVYYEVKWKITCSSSLDMCWLIDVWRAPVQEANSLLEFSSVCTFEFSSANNWSKRTLSPSCSRE